jgi:hypothetical protein
MLEKSSARENGDGENNKLMIHSYLAAENEHYFRQFIDGSRWTKTAKNSDHLIFDVFLPPKINLIPVVVVAP